MENMLEKIEKMSEKVFYLTSILDFYCQQNIENIYEIEKVSILTNCIKVYADELYTMLLEYNYKNMEKCPL